MCIIIVICISAFKTHQFDRGVVEVIVLRLNQRSGRKQWLRTGFHLTGVDWSVSGVVLISDIAKAPNERLDNDSKTVTVLYLAQVGLKCMYRDSEELLGKRHPFDWRRTEIHEWQWSLSNGIDLDWKMIQVCVTTMVIKGNTEKEVNTRACVYWSETEEKNLRLSVD